MKNMKNITPNELRSLINKITRDGRQEIENLALLIEEGMTSGYIIELIIETDAWTNEFHNIQIYKAKTEEDCIFKANRLKKQVQDFDFNIEVSNC